MTKCLILAGTQPSSGLYILLVEDDAALAAMYRLKLVAEGHRVQVAADGHIGLLEALAHPPDLLLLDVRIPGIDGLTLLAALRDDPRCSTLPVIVVTNYSDAEMIERGRRLGALAHLIKAQTTPGSLAEIIASLQLSAQDEVAAG